MKQLITILAFLQTLISIGQEVNVNNEIKKDFNDYFNLIAERKINEALNYSNPKLFEIVPKEQMKNLMEAIYKMPNIEYKTGNTIFLKFEELKKIENVIPIVIIKQSKLFYNLQWLMPQETKNSPIFFFQAV